MHDYCARHRFSSNTHERRDTSAHEVSESQFNVHPGTPGNPWLPHRKPNVSTFT